jgi:endopeptidase La
MEFNLQDFKMFCLQEDYMSYNLLLGKIQNHIQLLFKNNIISINDRNLRLSNVYEIIRKINTLREKLIMLCDNYDTSDIDTDNDNYNEGDEELYNSLKIILQTSLNKNILLTNSNIDNYIFLRNHLLSLYKLPKNTHKYFNKKIDNVNMVLNNNLLFPLKQINNDLIEFANFMGLPDLVDVINIFDSDIESLDNQDKQLFNLYNELFVPISVSTLGISIGVSMQTQEDNEEIVLNSDFFSKNIYLKQNNDGLHEELLDNYYSLILTVKDTVLKIDGYFKLDPLQIDIRLMSSNLYDKIFERKNKIDKAIQESEKFKKKYLKYCSVQELITLSPNKFLKYLDNKYKKFNEVNNKSFPSLMKDFVGKTMNLFNWFETIKLLLLGSDENINVAGSLFSLLKDKKTNISLVPDIIYDNLVFCNQMKLKKINQTLKIELDKLNELNFESIDLKKELARSTHIPLHIRSLAMEKVNEMKLNNNDYNKQLTFVKTVLQFPWSSPNDDNIFQSLHDNRLEARNFLTNVDDRLEKTTYGHKKVKEQISLLITKWISNPQSSGSAIGLLGPPGVGKTLIAKSLSKVLDIPMVMITLGGQNDAELLIGHGYTYSGAQPGMIVKKMCEAGKGRCIMYFDELDKSCAKHGQVNEITSILIHLTDPNTNKAFQDRFFQGIDFPLDKIIFIASYNDSNKIDPILLDRLIELEVKPYNVEDKINILRNFIIPELKENIGLTKNIEFSDNEIKRFIYDFTAESGVRDLKHKMEQVLLNINKQDLFDETNSDSIQLTYDIILKYLGEKNKNHRKMIPEHNKVGYVNGLYATTSGGGGITCIEICPMKTGDNFQLKLTGSMGDVMKESIQVAFTRACGYISDHLSKFNITDINKHIKDKFPFGFHIHAPEGATPKDGPSAGAAFTVGFVSAILEIPTNRTVAMTGEMNLSGEVTKIGGLVYKLIGAKFAGVKTALVPKQNEVDIKEILENNKDLFDETFNYVYIETLPDVIDNTLVMQQ